MSIGVELTQQKDDATGCATNAGLAALVILMQVVISDSEGEAMSILISLLSGSIALILLWLAFNLARFNKIEYQKSRARYPSGSAALFGRAIVRYNGTPDGRVRAGIVFNKKQRRIIQNGKLKNEVVDQVI
jgi:hypothetical protein